MELKPFPQPHPPFAYPSSNEAGASWASELGISIMLLSFFFSTLPLADVLRSLKLFAADVMPKLSAL